jgi:hypothetical protein
MHHRRKHLNHHQSFNSEINLLPELGSLSIIRLPMRQGLVDITNNPVPAPSGARFSAKNRCAACARRGGRT